MKLTKRQKITIWSVSIVGVVVWFIGLADWFNLTNLFD